MKRAFPVPVVAAMLLLASCGNGAPDDVTDISGVEMPVLLREIINANRARIFAPPDPNFWEIAAGLLTGDFDHEEDLRIAAAVRELAGRHGTFFGAREYPSGVPAGSVTSEQAAEDIHYFFDILRYGYTGYGYFGGDPVFRPMRDAMLAQLREMGDIIANDDFLALLSRPLQDVIFDSHFTMHTIRFAAPSHATYMNDDFITRRAADSSFEMMIYGAAYKILEIAYDDGTPADCLVPTITQDGEVAFALGVLAESARYGREISSINVTLLLENVATGAIISHGLALNRVNTPWLYDERPLEERPPFEERRIGGITVLENRHLWGAWNDAWEMLGVHRAYYEAGESMRGRPALILDMRWNYGGSSLLGLEWVRGFTGRDPAELGLLPFVLWTLAGHELGQAYYPSIDEVAFDFLPWSQSLGNEWLANPDRRAKWFFPEYPDWKAIANESLVIVLTDSSVSSAGEVFLSELMQMENVVVIGTNTAGVKLTGGIIRTALPNSNLETQFGSLTLSLRPDFSQHEGVGYPPDLWVHPRNSMERALAFIERHGIPR
ncbi:MAG: hypothetical protein FWE09_05180 [Treponema sp.]|nr:hypothetical protein [Treponema sp.]